MTEKDPGTRFIPFLMRKNLLFILSLLVFFPASAQATLIDRVRGAGDATLQWVKYGGKYIAERIGAPSPAQTSQQQARTAGVLSYLPASDRSFLESSQVTPYVDQVREGYDAQYVAIANGIGIGEHAFSKYSPQTLSVLVHHEIHHAKDYQALRENGYSLTQLDSGIAAGGNVLDLASKSVLTACLEARAYGEQAVFAYRQMKDHPDDPAHAAAYNGFVDRNANMKAFDEAVRSGASLDEARRVASIATLNDPNILAIYLDPLLEEEYHELVSVTIDDLMHALNDGLFTKEDLFKADGFWKKLCSSQKAKDSEACREYRRYRDLRGHDGEPCDCATYYGGTQWEAWASYCDVGLPFEMMSSRNAQAPCRTEDAAICCPRGSKARVSCPVITETREHMSVECWESDRDGIRFSRPYNALPRSSR
ncbi:MAG: hypothetical protein GX606_06440 [Elusimicrobia bacterium]|nr:hypothetical protein [Elusimicrobiota bacterium]